MRSALIDILLKVDLEVQIILSTSCLLKFRHGMRQTTSMHRSKHQMALRAKEIPFRTIFNTENSLKQNFGGLQDVTAGFYIFQWMKTSDCLFSFTSLIYIIDHFHYQTVIAAYFGKNILFTYYVLFGIDVI